LNPGSNPDFFSFFSLSLPILAYELYAMKKNLLILIACIPFVSSLAQPVRNKGYYKEVEKGFYDKNILRGIEEFEEKKAEPEQKRKTFKVDLSQVEVPKSVDEFKGPWRNNPVSQGATGTCWSFSTTSYFETEVFRITGKKVKISEMFTAYWEYVEKAKRFVNERGNSNFDEGSEANAVTRIFSLYGAVPHESYMGLLPGQTYHNHNRMVEEMKSYLQGVKNSNAWNTDEVLSTIRSILNHYMGEPPSTVTVDGKKLSPKQYLSEVLKLVPTDYVDVMSLMQSPYWTQCEYTVEDNWWHSKDYYNVPLDVFMAIIKKTIRSGYTLCIGGDTSESGFDSWSNVALVPTYDIPSDYIDESARQLRFTNKTTTDDHGMHLLGYQEKNGKDWYLIKDSGAGSRNCGKDSKNFGYYFFHEDYLKLKIMDFMVHKDMFAEYIGKFSKP